MSTILQTLQLYLSPNGTLALPANAFAGQIESLLNEFFPDGSLTATGVGLTQSGSAVQISNALCTAAPLAGMTFDATFAPDENDSSVTTLVLSATPPSGWTLATGWPLLGTSSFGSFVVSDATLTMTSYGVGKAPPGLAFSGTLTLPGAWGALQWILGGATSFACSGTIGQSGTAPAFEFPIDIGSVTLPVLGSVDILAVMASEPYVARQAPPNNINVPYIQWVPQTQFGVLTTFSLAGKEVPVGIDLSNPAILIPIELDTRVLATVSTADFASLLPSGVTLASLLPPPEIFDPGAALVPESLTLFLDPAGPSIVSVSIILRSVSSFPIVPGVSLTSVRLMFSIPSSGQASAAVLGVLTVEGGALSLGVTYPPATLTGTLLDGAPIPLDSFFALLFPAGPSFPLSLYDVDFSIQPGSGSLSLIAGLSGKWPVTIGAATVNLTDAWIELETDDLALTGTIGATITAGSPPLTIAGAWTIGGDLRFEGSLPTVSLAAISGVIAGAVLPASMPDITFTDGTVGLTASPGNDFYDFAMSMSASVSGVPAGAGALVVQQTSSGFGVLAGFAGGTWTPAATWPSLAAILGDLTISNAGLIVSTLASTASLTSLNLALPGLPATIGPGVALFGTVALSGSILGPLASLFPTSIAFSILAVIDTATPASTVLQAIFNGSSTSGSVTFTGITVTIQPQSESCSVTASATLDVGSTDPLTLSGTGTITAGTSPGLALTISVASWANAFGIDSLTLDDFGLSIGVEDEGVTVGFIGSFDVGQQFTFTAGGELIDFETPGAVIFSLDSDSGQTLMLSDLLTQFTTVDLSNVPILDSIGFTTLDFYAVDDPNGFVIDGYTFPAGIGITASVVIDTWAADLNLQIGSGSLIASGSISEPITIGAVFTLSDSAGTNGPSASINTTQSPYFTFDGQVSFLGISTAVTAAATISTFEFNVSFAFVATVTATLACQLVSGSSFSASTNVSYNLATTIGPIQEKGYTIIPQTAISTSANVALSLSITTSGATLSGTLAFSWSGQSWNPSFTLTAADIGNDLTNVASALESWLANNAASVFAGLTAPAWTQIVASQGTDGFGGLDGIAPILAVVFGIPAASGAALLQQLGFGFTDVVDALTSYFGETYSAAVAVAEALFGSGECQTETAADLAYPADPRAISTRELRFALTSSPRGRELLTAYYEHAEEVWSLLDANPFLRRRLEALERSRRGASDLDRLGDAVIRALTDIAGRSSPRLRETIAAVLPELARYRTLTHAELLAELQQ